MKVREFPIDKVQPYENYLRDNDGKVVELVEISSHEYGWRQPIVVDEEFVKIVGHTRLKAAENLLLTRVPVYVAEGADPERVRVLRLVDNPSGE